MNRHKPVVGEQLFSLNIGNAARWNPQMFTPVVVSRVGRKYFTCQQLNGYPVETEYHIETWREKTSYSPSSALYVSEQEYTNECEASKICAMIEDKFKFGQNNAHLSIVDLRAIQDIISKGTTT